MIKTSLFKHTLILLFTVSVLDFVGQILYFSWTLWWFDVILHFLSGACVGMATILAWNYFFMPQEISKLKMILIAFVGALTVGLLWEVYELYIGATFFSDGVVYIRDTFSDLIMDVCGGFFGTLYSQRFCGEKNNL